MTIFQECFINDFKRTKANHKFNTMLFVVEGPIINIERGKIDLNIEESGVYQHFNVCSFF